MTDESIGAGGVGEHYARIRDRVTKLVAEATSPELDHPVPACPGWRVRDVIGHLVGNVEDAAAGRLTGPPSEAVTAQQVARHDGDDVATLLAEWERLAPPFEAMISVGALWPAVIDLVSHEHDIRHALRRPGGRDDPFIGIIAERFAARLADRVAVELDGAPSPSGSSAPRLRVSSFELLRLTMGRRTITQVEALDWTGDPSVILSGLFVFGPAAAPIVE
jgi:uncharacterized protein (TIGR03083 family)